ncbi:MAG: YkgJ family cysteine cluster protein, partial [Candidatus Omnitrophica bacterium]|nr:YkgJ family cysteine cluster protein [Candidatus Omnitrophota bacterium]
MEEREMSEEAFKRVVKQRRKEKDMSFVLAVYRTYDEFLKKEIQDSGVKLACGKGCCSCCYQLISCTEMEISEVFRYINKIPRPRRRSLIKRLKKKAKEWQNYYQGNEAALEIDPFKPVRDWWGRPCPFLNEETGSCDIYSVRIIDCRTLSSLIPCTLEMETAIPCELH